MSNLYFFTLVALCIVVGGAAMLRLRRAGSEPSRLRCVKIAIGSFGSLAIVVGVQMLAESLPILVVAFAVIWLARRLARTNSPVVRFFDKQLAKMT